LQNLGQFEDHNKLSYGGLEDWAQQVAIEELEDYLKVSILEGCINSFIMPKHSTNCHLKALKNLKVLMFNASNSS
jgi:hypothetical protein